MLPDGAAHDLLMTSYPVSHARNADQFVEVAQIGAGPADQVLPQMVAAFGQEETDRILGNLKKANRPSASLALEFYWSRGAVLWAGTGPVRFRLSPLTASPPPPGTAPADGADALESDFAARLRISPVQFGLHLQKFVSEELTPIEDGAVEWEERDSPFLRVATLTIPAQDLLDAKAQATKDRVDMLAFNPWHAPAQFRPLGNLNRARRVVYPASARQWQDKGPD